MNFSKRGVTLRIYKISNRIRRNWSVSSRWIVHIMRICMHYTYFFSELWFWCDVKDEDFKAIQLYLTTFMKMFNFSKKMLANKNIKKPLIGLMALSIFHSSFLHLSCTHHNFIFVEGYILSIWYIFYNEHICAADQVTLPIFLGIDQILEEEVYAPVCVSNPGSGIYKRFCITQLIFIMDGQQQSITVIFHGKGKKIKSQ